jgi:hypothetical protein
MAVMPRIATIAAIQHAIQYSSSPSFGMVTTIKQTGRRLKVIAPFRVQKAVDFARYSSFGA